MVTKDDSSTVAWYESYRMTRFLVRNWHVLCKLMISHELSIGPKVTYVRS